MSLQHDHSYAFPSTVDAAHAKCIVLQMALESKQKKLSIKDQRICQMSLREEKMSCGLTNVLSLLKEEDLLSASSVSILQGRFSDAQLKLVNELVAKETKTTTYSPEQREFAIALFYYSPKAYDFTAKLLTLPMSCKISSIDCFLALPVPATEELKTHRVCYIEISSSSWSNSLSWCNTYSRVTSTTKRPAFALMACL